MEQIIKALEGKPEAEEPLIVKTESAIIGDKKIEEVIDTEKKLKNKKSNLFLKTFCEFCPVRLSKHHLSKPQNVYFEDTCFLASRKNCLRSRPLVRVRAMTESPALGEFAVIAS